MSYVRGIFVPEQRCSKGPSPTQGEAAKLDPTEEVKPAHSLSLIIILLAESSPCSVLPLVGKMFFLHYQNSLKAKRKLSRKKGTATKKKKKIHARNLASSTLLLISLKENNKTRKQSESERR